MISSAAVCPTPPGEKPYHIARFVEEVDSVRRALQLDRVILYGHSWGSILAIEYLATGHGAGVEKLVMGGAIASIPQFVAGTLRLAGQLPDGQGARLVALETSGRRRDPDYEKLIDVFYKTYVLRTAPTPDATATFAFLAKSPAYRVMNGPNEITVTGNLKGWDRRKELRRIAIPTLIVTGQYDEVSLDCHETIRNGINGSRLEVLPNCSHLAMQESPETYTRLLRSFLT